MAEIIVAQRMWQRRDTAANWTSKNPILNAGEWGVELVSGSPLMKAKLGDGLTAWNDLPYYGAVSTAADVDYDNAASGLAADNVQEALDEIKELIGSSGGNSLSSENVPLYRPSEAISASTSRAMWVAPKKGRLRDLVISCATVASAGATTVDMNKASDGLSVLATRPSIEVSERSSETGTLAAIDASRQSFDRGDVFLFDVDAAGTSAAGLNAVVLFSDLSSGGAISFVQASELTYIVGASQTVAVPASTEENDLLLAIVMRRSSMVTVPAGWVLVATRSMTSTGLPNGQFLSVYQKAAVAGEAGSNTTWAQSNAAARFAVQLLAVRKSTGEVPTVLTYTGLATSVETGGTASSVESPAITTPEGTSFIISVVSQSVALSGSPTSFSAPYGTLFSPSSVIENRIGALYSAAAAGATYSGNFTTNVGDGLANIELGLTLALG